MDWSSSPPFILNMRVTLGCLKQRSKTITTITIIPIYLLALSNTVSCEGVVWVTRAMI